MIWVLSLPAPKVKKEGIGVVCLVLLSAYCEIVGVAVYQSVG